MMHPRGHLAHRTRKIEVSNWADQSLADPCPWLPPERSWCRKINVVNKSFDETNRVVRPYALNIAGCTQRERQRDLPSICRGR